MVWFMVIHLAVIAEIWLQVDEPEFSQRIAYQAKRNALMPLNRHSIDNHYQMMQRIMAAIHAFEQIIDGILGYVETLNHEMMLDPASDQSIARLINADFGRGSQAGSQVRQADFPVRWRIIGNYKERFWLDCAAFQA